MRTSRSVVLLFFVIAVVSGCGGGSSNPVASTTDTTIASSSSPTSSPASATQVKFSAQPSNVAVGVAVTPAVQVSVLDAQGNVVTSSTAAVTVGIANNPGGATLGGTLTASAVNGVATFAGLTLNQVGQGYTLAASSSGLTGDTSTAFNVTQTGPGVPAKLGFTVQPADGNLNSALANVTVAVQDANGTTVPTATNSITLALGNANGASMRGTLTVAASQGTATFTALKVNRPGNAYTLSATATGLTGASSASFKIAQNLFALYATNNGQDNVTAFSVAGNGALTKINDFPVQNGGSPRAIDEDPFRRFVYVANTATGTLTSLSIVPGTGALTKVGDFKGLNNVSLNNPLGVVVDATGSFIYVTNSGNDKVTVFSVDTFTGVPTAIQEIVTFAGGGPQQLSLNNAGTLLAVSNGGAGEVTTFTVAQTGMLTKVGDFTAVANALPGAVVFSADGAHLYVTNSANDSVTSFTVNANGTLTKANTLGTGVANGNPYGLAILPDASRIFIGNQTPPAANTNMSRMDVAGNVLSNAASFSTIGTAQIQGVTLDPSGQFLYCVNQDNAVSMISAFNTQTLTKIGDFLTVANGNPRFCTVK